MSRSNAIRLAIIAVATTFTAAIAALVVSKVDLEPHNQWHMEVWEVTYPLQIDGETVDTSQPRWELVQSNLVDIFDAYDGMMETMHVQCPLDINQICKIYNSSADTLWIGRYYETSDGSESTLVGLILPGERSVVGLGNFAIWPKNKMNEWTTTPWTIYAHR